MLFLYTIYFLVNGVNKYKILNKKTNKGITMLSVIPRDITNGLDIYKRNEDMEYQEPGN